MLLVFRLNSIDDSVFLAIDAGNSVVNNGFGGENDAEDAVFHLNGINVRDKCCTFVVKYSAYDGNDIESNK